MESRESLKIEPLIAVSAPPAYVFPSREK